ncbi:MAG TPA: glycosyltransferase family 39 protein [Solirubrobacteraceae bacterium]|nr:glycosyltransferase family 39 protein [Solirubrobacteraceae bacterium]
MGTRLAPAASVLSDASVDAARTGVSVRVRNRELQPLQIVLLITLAAGVLRFATLDVQSVWLDESATIELVRRGFGGMLSHLSSNESTPPLYYVLVWLWTKLFGVGPLGFRSFSALVGTLTVPALYFAGREISPRTGVWAAALAAVNPATFYYSQEARSYGLLILFAAGAFVFWQRALERDDGRALAWWAAFSSLDLLTHYFALFLFVPEAAMLVRRLGARRTAAPAGVVVLVGVALAPLALAQRRSGTSKWIEEASLVSRVGETVKLFLVGLYGPLEVLTGALAGLLALGALALLLRRGAPRERSRARDAAIVAASGLAIPLALAAVHAIDVFDGRNVIAAWAPSAVLVAAGLGARRAGRAGMLLGLGLCAVSLAVVAATELIPAYQRDDWRGAAQALGSAGSGRVIVTENLGSVPLSIYLGPIRGVYGKRVRTRELDFVGLRVRHTFGSPSPPAVPTEPPPGFRLAGVERSEAFAVSRFLASTPTRVSSAALRRMLGEPHADIVAQR